MKSLETLMLMLFPPSLSPSLSSSLFFIFSLPSSLYTVPLTLSLPLPLLLPLPLSILLQPLQIHPMPRSRHATVQMGTRHRNIQHDQHSTEVCGCVGVCVCVWCVCVCGVCAECKIRNLKWLAIFSILCEFDWPCMCTK